MKRGCLLFRKFSDLEVESIIYTDINNDGVLKGPNFINILKYKNIVKVRHCIREFLTFRILKNCILLMLMEL